MRQCTSKPTYPEIVPVEEVRATNDLGVRLIEPRELPTRDVPRWLEIVGRADVERDCKVAQIMIMVHRTIRLLILKIAKDRVDQPLGCTLGRIGELSGVLDDVRIPRRGKDQDANHLTDRESMTSNMLHKPTLSCWTAIQYSRFSKSSHGSKDV